MKFLRPLTVVLTLGLLFFSMGVFSQAPAVHAASNVLTPLKIDLSHAVPDLSHPVPMNYPCPGQPHSSIGSVKTSNVTRSCNTSHHGVIPNASTRPNCSSGPYLLKVSGQSTWYDSNASADIGSWVQYYYCPSPGYPHGLNWSYGQEYPLSGCINLASGAGYGASMASSTGIIVSDGDPWQWFYSICSGSNYVQDYSQAADGSLNWQVWMYGYTETGRCRAESPTFG